MNKEVDHDCHIDSNFLPKVWEELIQVHLILLQALDPLTWMDLLPKLVLCEKHLEIALVHLQILNKLEAHLPDGVRKLIVELL